MRSITTCWCFTANDPLKRPSSPTARSMNSRGTKSKRRSDSRHCLADTSPRFPQQVHAFLDAGLVSPRESRRVLVEKEPKGATSGRRAARRRFGKHQTTPSPRECVQNRGFPRGECVIEAGGVTQVVTPVDGEVWRGGKKGGTEGKISVEERDGGAAVGEIGEEPRGDTLEELAVPVGGKPSGAVSVSRGVVTAGVELVDGGDWRGGSFKGTCIGAVEEMGLAMEGV